MASLSQHTKPSRTPKPKPGITLGDVRQRIDCLNQSKHRLVFAQLLEEDGIDQILQQLQHTGRRRVANWIFVRSKR